MHIQDKIGREKAKEFLKEYAEVHEWIPERVNIFKETVTYKFYYNAQRLTRDSKSAQIIFPLEFQKLLEEKIITKDQLNDLNMMLQSNNEADHIILEYSVDSLRNKRLKLKKKK